MRLSSNDEIILQAGLRSRGGYHLATQWYLNWTPLDYQYVFHHIPILNTTQIYGVGSGKAQPLSSRVLTPRGWRAMGDLREGCRVIAADGQPARIQAIFPQGVRPIYKVTTNDGESARADKDHLWWIQRRAGRPFFAITTERLQEMIEKYPPGRGNGFWLPFTGIAQFDPLDVPVDPYLLGLLIGDGSLTSCIIFTTADQELLQYVASAVAPYGLTPKYKGQYDYAMSGDKRDNYNPLTERLETLGLFHKKSNEKFIPKRYIYNSVEVRTAILQGLFDTDGSPARDVAVDYSTTSHELALNVQEIVRSLGGHAHISLRHTGANGKSFPSYRLYITFRGGWPFAPFRLTRKAEKITRIADGGGTFHKQIVSVKRDGEEEAQCLLIDHPSHLYITDGWMPTHNTTMVAASNVIDCITLPGFDALNASVTAKQAELAFEIVSSWRENNPRLNKLITDITLRPYPLITFWNSSTYTFRTAGQGAKFIRGHEFDRINYDEPGLDLDGEAVRVLRGRLRGKRADGSTRMARLDCTGTPTSAVWLRERFEKGFPGHPKATPQSLKQYFSMRVSTYENKHLSREQIAMMEAEYPPELIDVELRGFFPDYGLSMFPSGHVNACVDASMNDEMDEAVHPDAGSPKKGYVYNEWPRVGIVHFELPPRPTGLYIIAGDPGTDTPPRRNAACIGVLDIAKRPWRLVYFKWVNGQGSYRPFLSDFAAAAEKYAVVNKGIDATGPQKAIDELGFESFGLVVDGLNFGTLKESMLNSLLMAITSHNFRYPMIQGLLSQLTTYQRGNDKKLAQDIVMMLAMLAYMARGSEGSSHHQSSSGPNYRNRRQRTVQLERSPR